MDTIDDLDGDDDKLEESADRAVEVHQRTLLSGVHLEAMLCVWRGSAILADSAFSSDDAAYILMGMAYTDMLDILHVAMPDVEDPGQENGCFLLVVVLPDDVICVDHVGIQHAGTA